MGFELWSDLLDRSAIRLPAAVFSLCIHVYGQNTQVATSQKRKSDDVLITLNGMLCWKKFSNILPQLQE